MVLSKRIAQKLIKGCRLLKKEVAPVKIEVPVQPQVPPLPEKEEKEVGKIEIPEFIPRRVKPPKVLEEEKEKISLVYPLIPKKPAKGEKVIAYAKIFWDPKLHRYVYFLVEPELTDKLKAMLEKVKELLEQRLDVDFSKLKKFEAKEYLKKEVSELLDYFGLRITETEREILQYYIERDFIGLGKIEPLMQDDEIEDISCDGVGIPIFVFHRNPEIGSVVTNVVFNDPEELDSFIIRMSQLCGKSISVAQPLLDGALPDGSRLQATLATDIARRGSNFCIKEGFVQLSNGYLEDIRNLFEKYKSKYGSIMDEHGNEIVIPNGLKAIGADEASLTQEEAKILKIIKLRPPEKIVKVEFKEIGKSVSSIEVTENHKFHVLSEDGITTIEASKLTPGMWVAVPTRININIRGDELDNLYLNLIKNSLLGYKGSEVYVKIDNKIRPLLIHLDTYKSRLKDIRRGKTKSITFEEFLKVLEKAAIELHSFGYIECILRKGRKGRGLKIRIPLKFSEDFAYLLGWIIGDGSVTKDNISIHTGLSSSYKRKLLNVIYRLLNVNGKCYKNDPNRIYINSKIFSSILHSVFSIPIGKKSRKVDIPKIIEIAPNRIVASFLKGLFESDGTFRESVCLTTFSEMLATKTVFLLSRFGIFSKLYRDEGFRVFIPAEYYDKFASEITINKFIKNLRKKHDSTRSSKMLPAFYISSLVNILRKHKVKVKNIYKILNITDVVQRGRISFRKIKELNEHVKRFEENGLTQLIDHLTSGEFEFIEIVNVEIRDNTEKSNVYDIECNPVNFYLGGKSRPLFLHDTIRKWTEIPLTPVHLLNYGTLDIKLLAYLWFVVDMGRNILISGGTATGKTSLLNVLSLFIRPEKKIVSIEDTSELKLPHTHWVPTVARTAISVEGVEGAVDMFDLLKESFRQRPDYIIVGEVRGREAYVLFQQMAIGHPSLATIHAENITKLTERLTTPPISLPPALIGSLDLIIFILRTTRRGKFIRRVSEVLEVMGFNTEKNLPIVNQVFRWDPFADKFEVVNKSFLLDKISKLTGMKEEEIKEELERRMLVLNWMKEKNLLDYRDIHKVLAMYYSNPEKVLSMIKGEA